MTERRYALTAVRRRVLIEALEKEDEYRHRPNASGHPAALRLTSGRQSIYSLVDQKLATWEDDGVNFSYFGGWLSLTDEGRELATRLRERARRRETRGHRRGHR